MIMSIEIQTNEKCNYNRKECRKRPYHAKGGGGGGDFTPDSLSTRSTRESLVKSECKDLGKPHTRILHVQTAFCQIAFHTP